jgi:LPXTG-motif cell wall-anchored protein
MSIPGGSYSDSLSQSAENDLALRGSGQGGFFLNFVAGKGNTQAPKYSDAAGGLPEWALPVAGAVVLGAGMWFLFRKKKG